MGREKEGKKEAKTLTAKFRVRQPIESLCILVGAFSKAPTFFLFHNLLVITIVITYRSIERLCKTHKNEFILLSVDQPNSYSTIELKSESRLTWIYFLGFRLRKLKYIKLKD